MQKHKDAVAKPRQLILDALDYIWKNSETGCREWRTLACPGEACISGNGIEGRCGKSKVHHCQL